MLTKSPNPHASAPSPQCAKTAAQAEMLANRVKKRLKHLQKWAKRAGVDAFRLYDRDIPEIPLVLDLYGDRHGASGDRYGADIRGGFVSGALYKRPYQKDEQEEAVWLEAMREALARSLGTDTGNIIIKQRERQYGQAQYEKIAGRALIREIREGNYIFKVNLSDYLDTGLFLDRRALRALIGADSGDRHGASRGRRVLNLFCYTASFSIYAAGGGAASTDSVDLSNTYLGWARENFALNGFEAEQTRLEDFFAGSGASSGSGKHNAHRLIRADVNAFLRQAQEARYTWDSIILDPPAFSNSKMAQADFDLAKDYQALLAGCLTLLSPGGKLWFSASARSFRANATELEKTLAGRFPGLKVSDISEKVIDEDFRGKKTPKTFQLTDNSEQ
jgi:23S rRNA G2069 N7-methylase RlmK/C1962 C5-methylase RlmI